MRRRARVSSRRLVGALALILGSFGCARLAMDTGVPGVAVGAEIELHAERYRYLDATVAAGGKRYRFFFPRTEACRAILEDPEARFRLAGVLGTVQTDAGSCHAVGILSLRAWRDRQGRASRDGGRSLVPSDRIEYRVVYTDEDLFLAEGRFRIASEIGWPGGHDTIAVFPNSEDCTGVKESVRGMMEFRAAGSVPFSVYAAKRRCPVLGFAQILPEESQEGTRRDGAYPAASRKGTNAPS